MKRIGIDGRFYRSGTGGLGRYTRNLIRELAKLDDNNQYVVVLTPEDSVEFVAPGPNFQSLVVNIPHYSTAEQRELVKVLNRENFDLVHFANFNHPILYRRPFVITIHDMIMHLFPGGPQRSLVKNIAYRAVIRDSRRARKIIVPSCSTKNDLVSMLHFPESKIIVTAEGSEEGFRLHSEEEKSQVRAKFGLPQEYLLFVSRWEKYKGVETLLMAYEKLRKARPELGLVICGRPSKQDSATAELIHAMQNANPLVITPGFVSDQDLAALYSAATVYVHPSWYEGFGIMILEAFSAGVPVVTSNVSSLPEVVGDAGLLADPYNHNDFAAKICEILDDPAFAETLTKRGILRAKEFSWAKMAAQTLEVYRHVLD